MVEKPILETVGLGKVYGSKNNQYRALTDIHMQVRPGEFIGIMGPSGAGKSTLLNLISTIDRPTEGRVLIDGQDVFSLNDKALAEFRRKRLGFIFQDYNLLNQMNVYENITLPLALTHVPKKEQQARTQRIADMLRIDKLLNKNPVELSGGEKQRVTVARAIIMEPAVVMADEPTGALDSKSSMELMEVLRRMNKEQGVTIIMVTHDEFAASYTERIIRIKDGRIVGE